MADSTLVQYIQQYTAQGYSLDVVRSSLVSQGYAPQVVDEAIAAVQGSEHSLYNPLKGHLLIVAAAVFAVMLFMVFGYVLMNQTSNPSAPLHVAELPADEEPDMSPQFDEPSPTEERASETAPQDDVENAPTTRKPRSSEGLSRVEIDERVHSTAADDPVKAASLCALIESANGENSCYSTVASESGQVSFCKRISDVNQRDFCYVQFAIDGRGSSSVCANVVDAERRDVCLQLLALQAQNALENTTNISRSFYIETDFLNTTA